MFIQYRRGVAASLAVVALLLSARLSHAQVTSVINSDVESFFGSQSDAVQKSEPPISPTWTPVGFVIPHGPTPLPNVPDLYSGYPTSPENTVTPNIPFTPSHTPGSPYVDSQSTFADYTIFGGFAGSGTYTRNAYVSIGRSTSTLMYLSQPSTATGYAYEQVEFAIDYNVGAAGLTAGATLGTRPYLVYGSFLPGGSAEFGAETNYWWTPTSVNTITGVTVYGTPQLLGSLQYDDYIHNVTGPFASFVPDTYASNNLLGVPAGSSGILELTGDMYLMGDPVDISVESVVPEPASLALLAVGSLGLLARKRKANVTD